MRYYDLELTPLTGKTFLGQNSSGTRIAQNEASVSVYFESVDSSVYERYFDAEGYPQIREIEVAEADNTAQIEYFWAKSELGLADIEINKHQDLDETAIATELEWRTYRKELRAYATMIDGVYSYKGDRPTAPE